MGSRGSSPKGKVEQLIQKYDLDGVGKELEEKWLGEKEERMSLRELATYFNKLILKKTLDMHDLDQSKESTNRIYDSIHNDDSDTVSAVRTKREFERAGIDIPGLKDDFVSHQAIHTYLTKHRNVKLNPEGQNQKETALRTINKLQNRMIAVSESNIQRLIKNGEIRATDVEVFVNLMVFCNDCGSSQTITDYLEGGGCDCTSAD